MGLIMHEKMNWKNIVRAIVPYGLVKAYTKKKKKSKKANTQSEGHTTAQSSDANVKKEKKESKKTNIQSEGTTAQNSDANVKKKKKKERYVYKSSAGGEMAGAIRCVSCQNILAGGLDSVPVSCGSGYDLQSVRVV